jgi:hypothetical protein
MKNNSGIYCQEYNCLVRPIVIEEKTSGGIYLPDDIKKKRIIAQDRLLQSKVVYADWVRLRDLEMPSKEDIKRSIHLGGEHLKKIMIACKAAALKYAKPKKSNFY